MNSEAWIHQTGRRIQRQVDREGEGTEETAGRNGGADQRLELNRDSGQESLTDLVTRDR